MLEIELEFEITTRENYMVFKGLTKRSTDDLTEEMIKDRAYGILFSQKYDEELENTLRTMRAEAFVEFKELD